MIHAPTEAVLDAVRRMTLASSEPLVLAVSGGVDSMVLLSAMLAVAPTRIAAVATFDHGTGPAATSAAGHVARVARSAGLVVEQGRIDPQALARDGREAAWRQARYRFLRVTARALGARVVTAHTRDDQVETVLMRIMRGSGARGIAGLNAPCDVLRPFVDVSRAQIVAYAWQAAVTWVEDPSNASPAFFRNRIRHDILPALRRVDPQLDDTLLALAHRSADWRMDVDRYVEHAVGATLRNSGELLVRSADLSVHDAESLAVLWSSLAARAGLALDRRGTRRIAMFTRNGPQSGSIPLAGGWRVEATRDVYILRQAAESASPLATSLPTGDRESLQWGRFRFRVASAADALSHGTSTWSAALGAELGSLVRVWGAGDRLEPAAGQPRRRVTRYLSDVGMHGSDRAGWPVVVAGEDVVWIPGVRRSDAATDRSGRPVRHYICERIDR